MRLCKVGDEEANGHLPEWAGPESPLSNGGPQSNVAHPCTGSQSQSRPCYTLPCHHFTFPPFPNPLINLLCYHGQKSPPLGHRSLSDQSYLLMQPNHLSFSIPCSRIPSHLCMCIYASDSQTQREQSVTWACSALGALGCGIGSSLLHNTTCQHVEQHQWENQRPKDHPEYKEPSHALVQEPIR
jgi:hypothetical protein